VWISGQERVVCRNWFVIFLCDFCWHMGSFFGMMRCRDLEPSRFNLR
jgi:hypothetical protein